MEDTEDIACRRAIGFECHSVRGAPARAAELVFPRCQVESERLTAEQALAGDYLTTAQYFHDAWIVLRGGRAALVAEGSCQHSHCVPAAASQQPAKRHENNPAAMTPHGPILLLRRPRNHGTGPLGMCRLSSPPVRREAAR